MEKTPFPEAVNEISSPGFQKVILFLCKRDWRCYLLQQGCGLMQCRLGNQHGIHYRHGDEPLLPKLRIIIDRLK